MNIWENITVAQIIHDLIYQENLNREIIDYNSSYIIYAEDSKLRIRNYKNFLIYFINHYYLINTCGPVRAHQ